MNRSRLTTIDPALEANPAKLPSLLRRIWPGWIWELLPDKPYKSRSWVFNAIHAISHCTHRAFVGRSRQKQEATGVQPTVIGEVAQYRKPVAEIASYYADLHRSYYVVMTALGVCAVLCALIAPVLTEIGRGNVLYRFRLFLPATEGLFIVGMLWMYRSSRRGRWKEKATEYRFLSERLRHASALAVLARTPDPSAAQTHPWYGTSEATSGAERYYAQVLRAVGPGRGPTITFDKAYLEQCRDYLANRWLAEQVHYHERTHAKAEALLLILALLAGTAVGATLIVCLAELAHGLGAFHHASAIKFLVEILDRLPDWHKWLYIPGAFFPAFAGACHSVAHYTDLDRIALRSKSMVEDLGKIRSAMQALGIDPEHNFTCLDLATLAERAASAMIAEAGDWRVLILTSPTPAPH